MGALPSLDADLSVVLPVDYLSKTLMAVVTRDLSWIGKDYDFANTRVPCFDKFFGLMGAASAEQSIEPFSRWQECVLAYAATHPTTPLAHISPLLDGIVDDESAAAIFRGYVVGENVFGADVYPAPKMNEQYVQEYVGRINAIQNEV